MTRLAGVLDQAQRAALARSLAGTALAATQDAGLTVRILTGNDEVASWCAEKGVQVVADNGEGLSESLTAVVTALDHPWLVCHADLPLVSGEALAGVAEVADSRTWAIAPSLDGGTNVIAGEGHCEFRFGPGSFHAHLASMPTAGVIVRAELAIEVDTPAHLGALRWLGLAPSLVP